MYSVSYSLSITFFVQLVLDIDDKVIKIIIMLNFTMTYLRLLTAISVFGLSASSTFDYSATSNLSLSMYYDKSARDLTLRRLSGNKQ